jgi:predicted acetyltransferase
VRLERVSEANSGDLQGYAAERVALEEGGPLLVEAITNPDAYLGYVRRFAEGIDLPPNRVPGFEYWLLAGERILGNCRIRRHLIPEIELDGGHVSYDVRPSERGQGYGRELLRLALVECRRLGLTRVLLTTAPDNERSIRLIRANGGVELDRRCRPSAVVARSAGRFPSEVVPSVADSEP